MNQSQSLSYKSTWESARLQFSYEKREKKGDGKKIVNLVKKHDAVNTEEARKSTKAPKKCLWNMAIVILCSDESSVTAQRCAHWKKYFNFVQ